MLTNDPVSYIQSIVENDNTSMHEFIDVVSNLLHCPITLESRDFELLVYSGNHYKPDLARTKTILGKRVPKHTVEFLHEKNSLLKLKIQILLLLLIRCQKLDSVNAQLCVKKGKEVYIWIQIEKRNLSDSEKEMLTIVAENVSSILSKQIALKGINSKEISFILQKLLNHDFTSCSQIRIKALEVNIELPVLFTIATIYPLKREIGKVIRNALNLLARKISSTTYDWTCLINLLS